MGYDVVDELSGKEKEAALSVPTQAVTSAVETTFLEQLRQDAVPVSIYLKNGIQLKGYIESFDDTMIILKSDPTLVVVYKHAISTVMPTPTTSAPIGKGPSGTFKF